MAASQTRSIPVLLCGKLPAMGQMTRKRFEPKLTVVSFATPDVVRPILDVLLSDTQKPTSDLPRFEACASYDYSRPIEAIILGGGYDTALLDTLRKEYVGKPGMRKVPWLGRDQEQTKHDLNGSTEEQYADIVTSRALNLVDQLVAEGKIGSGLNDGLYLF